MQLPIKNTQLLSSLSAQSDGFPVYNPLTGEQIAVVTNASQEVAEQAVTNAHDALPSWSQTPAKKRAKLLMAWHDAIIENLDDLAIILHQEQGKPMSEARGEIAYGASYLKWFAAESLRVSGDILCSPDGSKKVEVHKVAVGVVAIITPWNFPHAMIARKVAPALAAGCSLVIKPSEETPLSAIAMLELAEEVGFPKGVLNWVTSTDASVIGRVLCHDVRVRKLSFTGSTAVGKLLLTQSAENIQKVSMELGGNAPFIVFKDADIASAISSLLAAKLRNAGQTCISPNRIFVHSSLIADFQQRLIQALSEYERLAPLINDKARNKATRLVEGAIKQGAALVYPSSESVIIDSECPRIMAPTVLSAVTQDMELAQTEVFAPVFSLMEFEDEQEVYLLANATSAGLAAYVFTENRQRINQLHQNLDFGMIAVNTGTISNEMSPFGGVKHSGFGREGSVYGIDDYLVLKSVTSL